MTERRPWGWYFFAAIAYGFLLAPLVVVVANSFNGNEFRTEWGGFTFEWYQEAWQNPTIVRAAEMSLVIAGVVTALSTIVGTATALALRRTTRRWIRAAVHGTVVARLVIPELLLALALLILLTRIGIARGALTIVVGHVVFNSAYVAVIVSARLAVREPFTDEAARDLGATAWRAFRRVMLPEIMPAVLAAALLSFTFSLDNIVLSFFLSGATNTLPLVILSLIRFEVSPVVNALGAALTILNLACMALFLIITWRWGARNSQLVAARATP
jgi:spermidine/putrescine transport system permease protein